MEPWAHHSNKASNFGIGSALKSRVLFFQFVRYCIISDLLSVPLFVWLLFMTTLSVFPTLSLCLSLLFAFCCLLVYDHFACFLDFAFLPDPFWTVCLLLCLCSCSGCISWIWPMLVLWPWTWIAIPTVKPLLIFLTASVWLLLACYTHNYLQQNNK